jgi:hypothetical protein
MHLGSVVGAGAAALLPSDAITRNPPGTGASGNLQSKPSQPTSRGDITHLDWTACDMV